MKTLLFLFMAFFALHHSAMAQCVQPLSDRNFENQKSDKVSTPWTSEGTAGVDIGKRLAHNGRNNAWCRGTSGWNAIQQKITLYAGKPYTLTGFIRSSPNMKDGYFGFRDAQKKAIAEVKFGPHEAYKQIKVVFTPTRTGTYHVFAGCWAINGDTWIQVDNLNISFPCADH